MKNNPQVVEWSKSWEKALRNVGDIEEVIKLWRTPMPRGWLREWGGDLGYRKKGNDQGEKRIERQLFEANKSGLVLKYEEAKLPINLIYHNMPFVNQRGGQVLADALGIVQIERSLHPLIFEVKVSNEHPWYALVENLRQLRLARACARQIQGFLRDKAEQYTMRGVRGMVLAPRSYFAKSHKGKNTLEASRKLLTKLKKETRARIAFGVWNEEQPTQIEIIASNWLNHAL
jgi:hypothetical protein